MIIEIEVGVINPERSALAEGNESQLLAKAGHEVKARSDVVAKLLMRGRGTLEDDRGGDVHVSTCPLHMQEGGIQPTESILTHRPIFAQPVGLGPLPKLALTSGFAAKFADFAV